MMWMARTVGEGKWRDGERKMGLRKGKFVTGRLGDGSFGDGEVLGNEKLMENLGKVRSR